MALNLDEMKSPPNPNSPEQTGLRMGSHVNSSPPQNIPELYPNPSMNQTSSNLLQNQPNYPNQQNMSNFANQSNVGQVDQRLEYQLRRYSNIISVITVIIILWDVLFIECFCLLRFSCIPDGVETPLYVLKALGCIFFFTLMIGPGTHYIVQKADKAGIRFFRYLNVLYIIALIVLFVVSFFLMGAFDQAEIISKWAELSPMEKIKYNDNIEDLVSENKTNLLLHAIYGIVLAVLFVLLTIYLFAFDYALPQVWLRAAQSGGFIMAQDSLIIVPKKKRKGAHRMKKGLFSKFAGSPGGKLPIINEERASFLGGEGRLGAMGSPSHQHDEPPRRAFDESPDRPARHFESQGFREPSFAQSPDRFNRNLDFGSPGEQGHEPRQVYTSGYNQAGGPGRFQNIEMVTSNYPNRPGDNYPPADQGQGGPGLRKRQF